SSLTPSSMPPVDMAHFDSAAIRHDEAELRASLPLQAEWLTPEGFRLAVEPAIPMGGLRYLVKRSIDLAGALTGLLLLAPVLAIIALLIRLDSRGPALFRQVRRGYRGRPFRVLKFRTMMVDAEQRLAGLEGSKG